MPNRKEAPKGGASAPQQAALPRRNADALGILAALVAGLLYLPALQHGWTWDDALLVASHGAGGAAVEGFRPFIGWLQRGEWWLGAGNPALFHFTGLIAHAVGTWLVFLLATHVGLSAVIAFVIALAFGAHPVHIESVVYATGRPAMIAAVFSIAAVLAARTPTLRGPHGARSRSIWWAYGLYALAALTDDTALVVPFILWGLDRWGPERVPAGPRRSHYAGFLVIWIVTSLLRVAFPAAHVATWVERGIAPGHELAALPLAAGAYLKLFLWPYPLNAMRSLSAADAANLAAWGVTLAGFVALAAIGWWRRHDAAARVGLVILVLGLLPALPFPGLTTAYVSERSAYLASAGFCVLAGSVLVWLSSRLSPLPVVIAGVLLAAAAGVATTARIPAWRNNVSLLQAAADADPSDPQPHLQLAEQHAAIGDAASALAELDRALARDSTLAEAHTRRVLTLGSLGRWEEAEAAARRAVALTPDNAESWANLGDALAQQGKMEEALVASRRAVTIDSTSAVVWYNYGVSLAAAQDIDGAAAAYRRALAVDSTMVEAWNNLGALYGSQGMLPEARDAYAKAVELSPTTSQARMNLALAYLRLGDKTRAAEERRVLQRIDPSAARRLAEFFQEDAPPDPKTPPSR